jgi:hypothetical protein
MKTLEDPTLTTRVPKFQRNTEHWDVTHAIKKQKMRVRPHHVAPVQPNEPYLITSITSEMPSSEPAHAIVIPLAAW